MAFPENFAPPLLPSFRASYATDFTIEFVSARD